MIITLHYIRENHIILSQNNLTPSFLISIILLIIIKIRTIITIQVKNMSNYIRLIKAITRNKIVINITQALVTQNAEYVVNYMTINITNYIKT